MRSYPFDKHLSNDSEVLDFFIEAIKYRNKDKARSSEIAEHVFDATHPKLRLSFQISTEISRLRDEFGALEAPGMPEDNEKDPDEEVDDLWQRLLDMTKKLQ